MKQNRHYNKLAFQLGRDEIRKVVKVTSPDGSSTVVGVLNRVDKTLVTELPPGSYDLDDPRRTLAGFVTLLVGPWQAQVNAFSRVVVEVEEDVAEVVDGAYVGELVE